MQVYKVTGVNYNSGKEEIIMYPVIRFDTLKDAEYPNGAWYATVDNDENTYDRFYGNTPDEALAKWNLNNTSE